MSKTFSRRHRLRNDPEQREEKKINGLRKGMFHQQGLHLHFLFANISSPEPTICLEKKLLQ